MKSNYYSGLLAMVLLMVGSMSVMATDYTAANEAAFLTALEQAANGDKIILSGDITLTAPVTIEKSVYIISDDEENPRTFRGAGNKLFIINPPEETPAIVFQSIKFTGGNSTGEGDENDGGAIRILSGHAEFAYCNFYGNYSSQDGGAIAIVGEGTYVRFYASEFTENESGLRGGAFFIGGQSTTLFEYCQISGNQTREDRGGGLFIDQPASVNFYYSLISSNKSGYVLTGEDPTQMIGRGGGAFCLNGEATVTIEASSIIGNTTPRNGSHGSAFFNMGNYNLTLINSTVAKNENRGAGSMFVASEVTCTITLVNCVYAENHAYDNAGNGSGIRVMNMGGNFNIFNSILAGNYNTDNNGATDMTWNSYAGIENGLVIKNSMIGLIHGNGIDRDRFQARIADNEEIENKSKVDYYNLGGDIAQESWMILDKEDGSGIAFEEGIQTTRTYRMGYYTFIDANAYAAKLGDPALLADHDIDTDFTGNERTVSGGTIAAGPLQGVYGYTKLNDPEIPDYIPPFTGISSPSALAKENIRVIGTVSNGILGVDFGNLVGRAKGELVAVNGQVVENVFDVNVIGKGYYNVKTSVPGLYLLRVTINDKTFTQRLILH
jgi:hypothetical protein